MEKVDDIQCVSNRPTTKQKCNQNPCPEWQPGQWSKVGNHGHNSLYNVNKESNNSYKLHTSWHNLTIHPLLPV